MLSGRAVSETTPSPRAWGLYLVDLSKPLGLCIAVPHPKSDANCEQLALRLWRAVPGSSQWPLPGETEAGCLQHAIQGVNRG